MRNSVFSAAILATLLGAGFATAEQSSGKITAMNQAAQTVTLTDGMVYSLDTATKQHDVLGGYLAGDTVTINWEQQGGKKVVSTMSLNFHGGVTGKISAINPSAQTVNLANGQTYTFQNSKNDKVDIGGFRVGDVVSIVTDQVGNASVGRAISTHEPADMAGKIRSINQSQNTVTLEDGQVYKFNPNKDVGLGGFRVGDMVKIEAERVGSSMIAQSISSADS